MATSYKWLIYDKNIITQHLKTFSWCATCKKMFTFAQVCQQGANKIVKPYYNKRFAKKKSVQAGKGVKAYRRNLILKFGH